MAVNSGRDGDLALSNYELICPLAEGGMGRIFLARQRSTGTEVVVKLMHANRADDVAHRRLFQAELRAMMRFKHPNAVALLDSSSESDPQPFLVLEHVAGISLEELIAREGRLTADRVGKILGPLCLVLQAAHDQDILHRDVTAANLMVLNAGAEQESIKVMDFGLARLGGFRVALDNVRSGNRRIGGGTPDYICPEQIRGEMVDGRGDLYSAGVVLYKALTGHLPFEGAKELPDILEAHRHQDPPPFAAWGPFSAPAAIEAVVRSCLAKQPDERPRSARELAERYGAALGRPIVAPQAFAGQPSAPADTEPEFAPESLIDRFDAWLPEAIATMKLQGFIEGVGGDVVESSPGLICVRLPGPVAAVQPKGGGFWSWFQATPPAPPASEMIELHLHKKPAQGRTLVGIAVVRPCRPAESPEQAEAGRVECRRVCRELRAYLMIGR
jgi:serine/threonine-protein kinase